MNHYYVVNEDVIFSAYGWNYIDKYIVYFVHHQTNVATQVSVMDYSL